MKILLDGNLPRKLKFRFSEEHQIFTVGEKGWNGKKNGELLGLMTIDGFDAFVTIDKNLQYQQNLLRFPIKIFILDAPNNKIETLLPFVENLKISLSEPSKIQVQIVIVS